MALGRVRVCEVVVMPDGSEAQVPLRPVLVKPEFRLTEQQEYTLIKLMLLRLASREGE